MNHPLCTNPHTAFTVLQLYEFSTHPSKVVIHGEPVILHIHILTVTIFFTRTAERFSMGRHSCIFYILRKYNDLLNFHVKTRTTFSGRWHHHHVNTQHNDDITTMSTHNTMMTSPPCQHTTQWWHHHHVNTQDNDDITTMSTHNTMMTSPPCQHTTQWWHHHHVNTQHNDDITTMSTHNTVMTSPPCQHTTQWWHHHHVNTQHNDDITTMSTHNTMMTSPLCQHTTQWWHHHHVNTQHNDDITTMSTHNTVMTSPPCQHTTQWWHHHHVNTQHNDDITTMSTHNTMMTSPPCQHTTQWWHYHHVNVPRIVILGKNEVMRKISAWILGNYQLYFRIDHDLFYSFSNLHCPFLEAAGPCMSFVHTAALTETNWLRLCARWLIKSPNLGNVMHKQGEVTVDLWSETHIVSGMPSLVTIFAAIKTCLCQNGGSIA